MIIESFVGQQAVALVLILVGLRAMTRTTFPSLRWALGRIVVPLGIGIVGSLLLRTLGATLL